MAIQIGRVLFRGWTLASICWIGGVGYYANADLQSKTAESAYVYQEVLNPNCEPRPCKIGEEDTYIKPSTYGKSPVFISHARKGLGWTYYDFLDGSVLLLNQFEDQLFDRYFFMNPTQTGAEAEYLKAAFWDQRWARYWQILGAWMPLMFWPIVGLAAFMVGVRCVVRGF